MGRPAWWDELAAVAEDGGCDRFSAEWYRSIRDQYRARFPDADQRSLDNMDQLARWAESNALEVRVVASSGEAAE